MKQFKAWPTGQQDVVRARIAAHKAADEITQGTGYTVLRDGKVRACAVGCSLDQYSHDEYSRVLGVDLRLAKLVDVIHEALPFSDAVSWPGRVAAALTPGADTTLAADRFVVWVLRQGVCRNNEHCAAVATLYGWRLAGREPALEDWQEAADSAASSASASAASSASASAASAAASAASSDYAYYSSTADHAAAGAVSAAARASDSAAALWRDASAALIEILERCEVTLEEALTLNV